MFPSSFPLMWNSKEDNWCGIVSIMCWEEHIVMVWYVIKPSNIDNSVWDEILI